MNSDDFPILAAVAANPAHSYELLDHLQAVGVKATRSTLYRRVETLAAMGLLEATEVKGPRGHLRRSLVVTAAGRDVLAGMAARVLQMEPLESPLFALAVGCADAVAVEDVAGTLRRRMGTAARRLTEEERALGFTEGVEETWRTAGRERRIAHLQADIAWLQSVAARAGGVVHSGRPWDRIRRAS